MTQQVFILPDGFAEKLCNSERKISNSVFFFFDFTYLLVHM